MASLCYQKLRYFSISVITSITLRLMGVSLSWMNRLGIDWRIPTEHANLSEKDTKHEVLKDFDSPFEY